MTATVEALARPVVQVAVVVRDLDAALERYAKLLPGRTWRCFTFASASHVSAEYRGRRAEFSVRLAVDDSSPQLELVQPLQGDSIHRDWLEERGEGFHHVGIVVDSVSEAVRQMAAAGHPVVQGGTGFGAAGDGAYAYVDTTGSLGTIVEVFEPPASLGELTAVVRT